MGAPSIEAGGGGVTSLCVHTYVHVMFFCLFLSNCVSRCFYVIMCKYKIMCWEVCERVAFVRVCAYVCVHTCCCKSAKVTM